MDGVTALAYSRIRFSSDDLDRIQRQQRVIFAAIDKAKSLDVLKNPLASGTTTTQTIETDIRARLIPGYGDLANQVKDNLLAVSLGSCVAPFTTAQGAQVLVGDEECIVADRRLVVSGTPGDCAAGCRRTPSPVRVRGPERRRHRGSRDRRHAVRDRQGLPARAISTPPTSSTASRTRRRRSSTSTARTRRTRTCYRCWLGIPATNAGASRPPKSRRRWRSQQRDDRRHPRHRSGFHDIA